ncbi:MAG: c-type cytochrome biogenesis protein CcmI [Pseudomonadota bacterium]
MVWAIVVLLALIAVTILVEPFFRTPETVESLEEEDYLAAQIADVARDRKAGLITEEEAAAADLEARRRLLSAHRADQRTKKSDTGFAVRQASAMLIAAAPIAAIAIYAMLGNPAGEGTEEGAEIAARSMIQAPAANPRSLAESIETLEARLADNPDVLDDWILLAESYAGLDRFDEAATAFGKARALAPEQAFLHAAEGEAIAMAAGGIVTPEARAAFARALDLDAAEPRARFYAGLDAYQQGRPEEALTILNAITQGAPPDAPWLPIVRTQIEFISTELGRPVPAQSAATSNAAQLEADIAGGDAPYESWIALIDAYASSGEIDKAQDAVARARARYENAPFVLQQIAAAQARIGADDTARGPTSEQIDAAAAMSAQERAAMIEGMVTGLAARLEQEPDDLEGWVMLARSYGVLGDAQKSAEAYARAIALSPEDIDLHIGRAQALIARSDAAEVIVDDEIEATVNEIARLNPDHPFALYFQGLVASERGDGEAARQYWTQLVDIMPKGSPEAARVQAMIDAL